MGVLGSGAHPGRNKERSLSQTESTVHFVAVAGVSRETHSVSSGVHRIRSVGLAEEPEQELVAD